MARTLRLPLGLAAGLLWLCAAGATGQTFRVSFDTGLKADRAVGRAEPWVSRDVELVPGRFGKAAQLGPRIAFVQSKERGYWTYLATMEWQETAFRAMAFD